MRQAILAGLAALSIAGAATAEVTDRSPAGFQVRRQLEVAAPPAKLYQALTDIGGWWSSGHTWSGDAKNLSIDPVGGCFCEVWPKGRVRHMTVVYAEPGKSLHLFGGLGPLQTTGAAGHLNFDIAAKGAGSTLTMTYDVGGYAKGGLAETWAAPVDAVLGEQLGRLKTFAETGKAQ